MIKKYITKTPVGYTLIAVRILGFAILMPRFRINYYPTLDWLNNQKNKYIEVHHTVFKLFK